MGRQRLIVVLVITGVFMVIELVGGWIANSLALMADAGHMLSDVAALALSLFALTVARKPATAEKTFGYFRIEILAALANGVALAAIAVLILTHAYQRLRAPEPVDASLMLVVAAIGLAVNVAAALILHAASEHNLNVRSAYLHVLGDLLGSVGAIVAALIIVFTGWLSADPIVSAFVACLILAGSWRLIRESVDVLLEAVPKHIDLDRIRITVESIPGVHDVRDLHVWTLTSGYLAMSGHAAIDDLARHADVLREIHTRMHDDFGISHVTIQLEPTPVYQLGAGAGEGAGAEGTPGRGGGTGEGGARSGASAGNGGGTAGAWGPGGVHLRLLPRPPSSFNLLPRPPSPPSPSPAPPPGQAPALS